MKFKSVISISTTALFLATSGLAFADSNDVSCPSVDSVKKAVDSLDTVRKSSEVDTNLYEFNVWSAYRDVVDGDSNWALLSGGVAADFNAAYAQAVTNVQNIVRTQDENAVDMGGFYFCVYLDGGNNAVAATVTYKDDDDQDNINKALKKISFKK